MTGNILIVDDEAQLRKLLARIISLEGFKVTEADSLKAAANHLKVQTVDVVLCDVKLPDGNGVDFVKTVRANFPSSEIILCLLYTSDAADERSSVDLGGRRIIKK